ncbi:MAG: LAGLIDADG family homing endonuclease [Deltaproteobacteria bacterium]|nr:LAGLIDADG family homing endonuclease [Deltaproteobacteria bacterium]
MNSEEKAYIAGIIDGEGTITLTKHHKNETPIPVVSISNCKLELLEWIRSKINSGNIMKKKRRKSYHSDAFELRVRNNLALELLRNIKDYLILKHKQADLILLSYKKLTVRNDRYTPEQLDKKNQLVKEIRILNQR